MVFVQVCVLNVATYCADDSPLHYRFQAAGASATATISVGLQGGGDAAKDGILVRLHARVFCLLSLSCPFNRDKSQGGANDQEHVRAGLDAGAHGVSLQPPLFVRAHYGR